MKRIIKKICFSIAIIAVSCSCNKTSETTNLPQETKPPTQTEMAKEPAIKNERITLTGNESVEELIVALNNKNFDAQESVVNAFVKIGEPAVEPLIAAFKGANWNSESIIPTALNRIDPKWTSREIVVPAVAQLIQDLKNDKYETRNNALKTLINFGIAAEKPLISALHDPDANVIENVSLALESIDSNWINSEEIKETLPTFIQALKGKDSNARGNSATVLKKIGDQAIKPLILSLKDDDRQMQKMALWLLKDIAPDWPDSEYAREAVPELIAALKNENQDARLGAVTALEFIRDPRSIEPLITALSDNFLYVREGAFKALKKLTEKDFGRDKAKWEAWWKTNKKSFIE